MTWRELIVNTQAPVIQEGHLPECHDKGQKTLRLVLPFSFLHMIKQAQEIG